MHQLTFEVLVALFGDLIQEGKGGSVMVRPVIVGDPVAEVPFCVVGGPLRSVDDIVLVSMFFVQELGDLLKL